MTALPLRVSTEPATVEYRSAYFAQGEDALADLAYLDWHGPESFLSHIRQSFDLDGPAGLGHAVHVNQWQPAPIMGREDLCYWVDHARDNRSGWIVSRHHGGLYVAVTEWRERAAH